MQETIGNSIRGSVTDRIPRIDQLPDGPTLERDMLEAGTRRTVSCQLIISPGIETSCVNECGDLKIGKTLPSAYI